MTLQHLKYLLLALPVALCTSCSESDSEEEEYPESTWRVTNAEFFNQLINNAQQYNSMGDNSWKVIRSFSRDAVEGQELRQGDFIVAHVLNSGEGPGCPLFSDTVLIHYEGRLLPSKSYPEGKVFDCSWNGDFNPSTAAPVKRGVFYTQTLNASTQAYVTTSTIDGFSTALQNMHVGDRWMVYIPQELGYKGEEGEAIPAYSTLLFDITLVAYYHPGEAVPDWKSNAVTWWHEE